MKKILKKFARDLIFPLSRDLPLEGQKTLTCFITKPILFTAADFPCMFIS